MWSAGNRYTDVYIGTRLVALSTWGGATVTTPVNGFAEAIDALKAKLGNSSRREAVRVWLSGGLCRPFVLESVTGISNAQDVVSIAVAVASQRTGLDGKLTLWMESRPKNAERVVVAIQDSTLELIRTAMTSYDRRLISLRPWWAEVLHEQLSTGGVRSSSLAVQDCDSLTVIQGEGANISMACTFAPVFDSGSARGILARALASQGKAGYTSRAIRLALPSTQEDLRGSAPVKHSPGCWVEVMA